MKINTILFALMAMSATMAMASPRRLPAETVKRCDNDQCDNQYDDNNDDNQYDDHYQDNNGPITVPYYDGKPCGFGPYNYGPDGFNPDYSSGPVHGLGFVNHRQHHVQCPDGYSHDSDECCYDAYGNLAYPKDGCDGEVVPPRGQRKQSFTCSSSGGDGDSGGNINALNCIDICILSRHCPKKKTCRAQGGNGDNLLGINALNCDNLNILGMNIIG